MQECYRNAWKGTDFQPDHFAEMVWSHVPGEAFNFEILFQVQAETEQMEKLFDMKMLSTVLEIDSETFLLKVRLDDSHKETLIVKESQTLAEVKSLLKQRFPQHEDLKLFSEGRGVKGSNTLGDYGIRKTATLDLVLQHVITRSKMSN